MNWRKQRRKRRDAPELIISCCGERRPEKNREGRMEKRLRREKKHEVDVSLGHKQPLLKDF